MLIQTKPLPRVLTFGEAKYYIFSFVFTGLAVFTPWLTHQFHLAGQIFLPMHIFVLTAGFLFGWRAGLMVGVLSPLSSYLLTQMPVAALLPQVILELAVYGVVIGLSREKNLNVWVSLFSAMVLGRLARVLFISLFVPGLNALQFISLSLPGIVLQIALIPLIIRLTREFIPEEDNAE
ncbi:MAG: ECF transporter S component [Candidatus Nealsonbacteria bacterium]|nr:ECF transporter S component [Candidatus Nealsonbacteria bacterium]